MRIKSEQATFGTSYMDCMDFEASGTFLNNVFLSLELYRIWKFLEFFVFFSTWWQFLLLPSGRRFLTETCSGSTKPQNIVNCKHPVCALNTVVATLTLFATFQVDWGQFLPCSSSSEGTDFWSIHTETRPENMWSVKSVAADCLSKPESSFESKNPTLIACLTHIWDLCSQAELHFQ